MASGNSFAALADNDDEVPNQAGKKPQAVAGTIPHVSTSGQKGQGKDRQPVISERVIARHPGGDKPAHSGAGPRRADRPSGETHSTALFWLVQVTFCNVLAGGRSQRVGGSKSDVVKVRCPIYLHPNQSVRVKLYEPITAFVMLLTPVRPTPATMLQAPPELMRAMPNLLSLPPPR